MKIKAKGKETMFWCHIKEKMVSFDNGIADVPKDIGNAMIKNYGYEEYGVTTDKKVVTATESPKK